MKKIILSTLLLSLFSVISFAQTKKDIPYKVASGYFVKNATLDKYKFTNQKSFDAVFGTATVMAPNGKPTTIDFKKQYVIAVCGSATEYATTIEPVSLKKVNKRIIFESKITPGEKLTATILPLLMIVVDKKYNGVVEVKTFQTTPEGSPTKGLTLANNQWIIEYFNQPARTVSTKNSYITIDAKGGTFTGKDACNIINGKVKINGESIAFENMISTKMACREMEQANLFVKNLQLVNQYKIVGGELFLYQNEVLVMTLESFK